MLPPAGPDATALEPPRSARPAHPSLAALLRVWEDAVARDGCLPPRRRFGFEAMVPWLGHIAVFAVERDPLRFRATLIGTRLVEWDGQDGTGRHLDTFISPANRDSAIARYAGVAATGRWHADVARIVAPRTTAALLHRLLLPCADDGATVDRIVTAIFREETALAAVLGAAPPARGAAEFSTGTLSPRNP